jgi:Acetoacetate decarboxylase (ADC)
MPRTADPATVLGLPESSLLAADLAALPSSSADAPWTCTARAVTWIQRARTPQFDWEGRPLPLAMVTFVEYLDTPVGSYSEILAGAVLRPGPGVGRVPATQVPFIAVDSLASVHGGRANWALPKTMASFELDLPSARAHATGDGWSVDVRPLRPRPLAPTWNLPVRGAFRAVGPLGRYTTSLRSTCRPALVRSEVTGPVLAKWLGSGTHLAFVLSGQMTISAPKPAL